MFLLNDKPLPIDTAFTHDCIQYPANWIRLASADEKIAIGITEVPDPVRADDRFYWDGNVSNPKALDDRLEVKEDGTPLYVQRYDAETQSMVDTNVQVVTKGLKSNMVSHVKQTAGSLLAHTDWYVTRKFERGVEIPEAIAQERSRVVEEANRLESAIQSAASVEELMAVMNSQQWGEK